MDFGFLMYALRGLLGVGLNASAFSRTLTHSWSYVPGFVKGLLLSHKTLLAELNDVILLP